MDDWNQDRGGFHFGVKDVFVNIAGGLKVEDPSIDLAMVSALLSSYEDVPVPQQVCFAGEVGLSGEIRPVYRVEQRIAEAEKLGFERILVSRANQKNLKNVAKKIELVYISKIEHMPKLLFG